MSTCSTATSARRRQVHKRRCSPSCQADAGHLETRMRDLERDWDAYKASRYDAPRHRRSRSATGTPLPSSDVTAAVPSDLYDLLRCTPRQLVSSLQQAGSADSDGAATVEQSRTPTGPHEEDAFSVCSVEAGHYMAAVPTATSLSCSCHCRCAVLCCGYSTSSSWSWSTAAASSFLPAAGSVAGEIATKRDEGWWATGHWIGRFAAIALVAVGFIVVMAILELGVDEGCAEFLVPT